MLPSSEQNREDVSGICISLQNKEVFIYLNTTKVGFEFSDQAGMSIKLIETKAAIGVDLTLSNYTEK